MSTAWDSVSSSSRVNRASKSALDEALGMTRATAFPGTAPVKLVSTALPSRTCLPCCTPVAAVSSVEMPPSSASSLDGSGAL